MAEDELSYKIAVIGGSAGSLDVALKIIAAIPAHSPVVIIVVLHRKNDPVSYLTDVFSSRTSLPVKEVEDKEPIEPNTVYIAPADYHLLFENKKTFALDSSEKVNFSRPSIDVTFESAAQAFGANVIGVLLSGANADGAQGLQAIKAAGGFTIVQSPETAEVGFMPQQAINAGAVDKIVPAARLAELIRNTI